MRSRVNAVSGDDDAQDRRGVEFLYVIATTATPSMTATIAITATANRSTSLSVVPLALRWRSKKFTTVGSTQNCTLGASRISGRSGGISSSAACGEVEHARDRCCRERLTPVVVVHHGVVVGLPRERDLVLGRGQLLRQLHHVLVRLEVGVLLGDGDEPAQRAVELRPARLPAAASPPDRPGWPARPTGRPSPRRGPA